MTAKWSQAHKLWPLHNKIVSFLSILTFLKDFRDKSVKETPESTQDNVKQRIFYKGEDLLLIYTIREAESCK